MIAAYAERIVYGPLDISDARRQLASCPPHAH
jgi:hypothetical protein